MAFLRLVEWFSEASTILGLRYANVGGVLSSTWTFIHGVACATCMESPPSDTWRELPPRSGDTFSSSASMTRSSSLPRSLVGCKLLADGGWTSTCWRNSLYWSWRLLDG